MRKRHTNSLDKEQRRNRRMGLCWCGKKFVHPLRKYCSNKHRDEYYAGIKDWNEIRKCMLHKSKRCNSCTNEFTDRDLQIDHIVAISLGGDEFAKENLQILCTECHKVKTRSDIRKLRSN